MPERAPDPDRIIRLETPPDRHIAAAVMVAEDGRYLLQLRDDKPGLHLAGHWALFGGGIEPGESAEAALRRELVEELGFTAGAVAPIVVSAHAIWPSAPVYRMSFFAVPFRLEALDRMVQTEGADKGLFTLDEACRLPRISPWDLCALLLHGRHQSLFPDGRGVGPIARV
jgi:8-oxo-dGTP pyrophosphatase MutT (NUDIX family)